MFLSLATLQFPPPLQKTGAGSAVKVLQRHAPAIGISVLEVLGYTAGPGMQIFK